MKRVMTLNQKQIRNPAGEDTFSLAPDEAGTVAGGRTYRLDSSEKNKEIFNRLKNICNVKHINAHQALFGFYFGCDLKSIPLISARNVSRLKEVIDNCNTILDKQDIEYLLKERFH